MVISSGSCHPALEILLSSQGILGSLWYSLSCKWGTKLASWQGIILRENRHSLWIPKYWNTLPLCGNAQNLGLGLKSRAKGSNWTGPYRDPYNLEALTHSKPSLQADQPLEGRSQQPQEMEASPVHVRYILETMAATANCGLTPTIIWETNIVWIQAIPYNEHRTWLAWHILSFPLRLLQKYLDHYYCSFKSSQSTLHFLCSQAINVNSIRWTVFESMQDQIDKHT